jgi:GLPGLI family protein
MLKNIKIGLIAFICLGSTFVAQAQKVIKEGTATYAVEYDLPAAQQSMAAMLPKEFKVQFKGDYSKFKMDMGMYATEVMMNNATKETLSLTDVPIQNKKIAVKMNQEQTKKMQEMQSGETDIQTTVTTEKKLISGYNCTKYLLKDKISGNEMEVWATMDIVIPTNTLTASIKNVKGVPVEFSSNARGMKSKMTLKSVSEQPVPDIKLDIPTGYETMTFEDLMSQMGG